MMSSICFGSSSGLRRRSAFITSADSTSERTFRNMPPFERPIGVRTASTTTASLMASLRVEALAGAGQGGELPCRRVERAERPVLLRGLHQRRGGGGVGPAEDAAPERWEAQAVEKRHIHLYRRRDDPLLEHARGLEQHRQHQALHDLVVRHVAPALAFRERADERLRVGVALLARRPLLLGPPGVEALAVLLPQPRGLDHRLDGALAFVTQAVRV